MEHVIIILGGCWIVAAGIIAYRKLKKDFQKAGMEEHKS